MTRYMDDTIEILLKETRLLEQWTVLKKINQGRTGTVYLIEKKNRNENNDVIDELTKALKIVDCGPKPPIERLKKVFKRISDVPHTVYIEDWIVKEIYGRHYLLIWMELLDPLPPDGLDEDMTLCMAYDIGSALHKLHDYSLNGERIYHCDIEPGNIMYSCSADGSVSFKLCDFDDARIARRSELSVPDGICSPGYRAPEKKYDNRSELYSLGVTMYTLLNGGRKHKGGRFPRIKGVHRDVMRLIWRLCRKNPSKRFDSANDFLEALTPVLAAHQRMADRRAKKISPDFSAPETVEIVPSRLPDTGYAVPAKTFPAAGNLSGRKDVLSMAVTSMSNADISEESPPKEKRSVKHDRELYGKERNTLAIAAAESRKLYKGGDPHRKFVALLLFFIAAALALVICSWIIPNAFPNYIYLKGQHFFPMIVSSKSEFLDLSDEGLTDISPLERCDRLILLDLRGNPIDPETVDQLQLELPQCTIIRDVFIGNTVLGSDAESLSTADFAAGDEKLLIDNLGYFPDLTYIDMSGSALTREELVALRDSVSDKCTVYWTELLDGKVYGLDARELELSTFDDNTVDALSNFYDIEYVDLSKSSYSDAQLDRFRSLYPEYDIRWTVSVFGQELSTKTTSLSLRGVDKAQYNEQEELSRLEYFEELESLDLYGTKFDDYGFLKKCRGIKELYLRNSLFDDFSMLPGLKEIRSLDIGNLKIGDTSFLAGLTGLRRLRIDRSVLDSGFENNLTKLTELRVLDCSFTGIDLAVLADMPDIRAVRAYDNPATRLNATFDTPERNRAYFNQLRNVSTLEVLFANIDETGLKRAVQNCENLKVLNVLGWKYANINLNILSNNKKLSFLCVPNAVCSVLPEHLSDLDTLMACSVARTCSANLSEVSPDCMLYDLSTDYYANFNDYCGYDSMLLLCEIYAPDCLEY